MTIDLFALGQEYFYKFKAEFEAYGIEADPALDLRQGKGLLCYYNLDDRQIYLSVPDFNQPTGKLQAIFLRSLLGCESNEDLFDFLKLFIPHVIAHEMAHHFRHRYGLFSDNLWEEEQIANKLSVAVTKHRFSPAEKNRARALLRRAMDTLAAKIEAKNIAIDSYYSVLHAMNVSGQIDVSEFEDLELLQTSLGISADTFIKGSHQLSAEQMARLENRADLIESINEQYTSDQIKYIYYHVGWLYLDLASRETEYVDEFARNYLNLSIPLLPVIKPRKRTVTYEMVQACYQAYLDTWSRGSEVASRYFYKRYRSLLLTKLKSVQLKLATQTEQLRREVTMVLESWREDSMDMLHYLAELAPAELKPLFPQVIAENLDANLEVVTHLPTKTDRRLWQHIMFQTADIAAVNTLYRLSLIDQTDIYRPLPAELILQLVHLFYQVRYAPGEAVIWEQERNDDVYIVTDGLLEALITQNGTPTRVGEIKPGEMFGEIAFFTEDPRYATVRAVEPSHCFVLTNSRLQLMAFKHPAILMRMASVLARRLGEIYGTSRREMV